jgi:PEP-CTERM motif
MKRLALSVVLLFVVLPVVVPARSAYADSIPTFYVTQVNMFMSPNDGSGDNIFFTLTGPGVNIAGIGGMACSNWCFGPIADPNDPSVVFTTQIFLTAFGIATIGGTSYDPSTLGFASLFDDFGGVNASTAGAVGAGGVPGDFLQFKMILPMSGGQNWTLHFDPTVDQNGNPAFIFTEGDFTATGPTPEPATVGLMLTGLAGIAWRKYKAVRH